MDYIGDELDLFKRAKKWKSYWTSKVARFIKGRTLEVGAGLGGNIEYLSDLPEHYTALEPDKEMAKTLETQFPNISVFSGTISDLPVGQTYDTILYIDVLEHIDDDKSEFDLAINRLAPGGHLIVLCPAHQYLFSAFDKAVGHFRRHTKSSFKALTDDFKEIERKKLIYLDSVGMLASLTNKWFLKSPMPTQKQVDFWDSTIVPISKLVDILTFNMIGKTVIGVWIKTD